MIKELCPACGKTHAFTLPDMLEVDTVLFRCQKPAQKLQAIWFFHPRAEGRFYVDVAPNTAYIPFMLRKIRKEAGLSQQQLAEMLGGGGYTDKVVSAIESGKRKVGLQLLQAWADACEKNLEIDFW